MNVRLEANAETRRPRSESDGPASDSSGCRVDRFFLFMTAPLCADEDRGERALTDAHGTHCIASTPIVSSVPEVERLPRPEGPSSDVILRKSGHIISLTPRTASEGDLRVDMQAA